MSRNLEILSLFNSTKIIELRNSGILVSLKIPNYGTSELYFFLISELLF